MCGKIGKIYVEQCSYGYYVTLSDISKPSSWNLNQSSYLHRDGKFYHSVANPETIHGNYEVNPQNYPGYWQKRHAAIAAAKKTGLDVVVNA